MTVPDSVRVIVVLAICLLPAACGGGGGNPPEATSILCDEVVGNEAILWDYSNGVIRTDSVLPPPVPVGASFTHTWAPLLSFSYSADWLATEIAENFYPQGSIFVASRIGVDVLRKDSLALWRYLYQGLLPDVSGRGLRDAEMTKWLAFFGLQNEPMDILCTNEGVTPGVAGANSSYSNIMFRSGELTFLFANSATQVPGSNMYSALSKVAVAPTDEFQARALDSFLAIDWQLLITDSSNIIDSDGDGWRDGVDADPYDPAVH